MKNTDDTTRTSRSGISRRGFMKTTAAAATAASVMGFPAIVRAASDRKIVIRDPGGPFTPGFHAAFYEPFTKATGIHAIGVQGQHEPVGLIKAMVEAKNYTWDMALVSEASHNTLVHMGYLAPVAPKGGPGPNLSQIPENMRSEFIAGDDVYATNLVYSEKKYKDKPPHTWADFWNAKAFPGIRGAHKYPFDTLEFALMADGVPKDKVYPIDVDRAFKSLDKLKPEVNIWWTGGAQTSQLIQSGEVDLIYTWNGRAQVPIDAGAPYKISWYHGMWTYEGWCILKGGPNEDLCREFIEFSASGEAQARFTKYVAYGPTNPNAYKYIDKKTADKLPTNPKNLKQLLQTDTKWWGKHQEAMIQKFNAWLLS